MPFVDAVLALRPYGPGDDQFIIELSKEAFGEYTANAGTRTLSMARNKTTFVAVRAGIPIGFIVLELLSDRVASLQAIAVIPEERGRGFGRRLLRGFEKLARDRGAQTLELCTADGNLAALDLFMKLGFQIKRRLNHYYGRGQDACLLAKRLSITG